MPQIENKILKLLLNKEKISKDLYQSILDQSKEVNLPPDVLLETKKIIPEEEIMQAKSEIYSVPIIDLYGFSVDRKILQIIPRETAENYKIAAFAKEGDILKVAISNPGNFKAREAVNFIAKQKNLKAEFYTTADNALKNILAQYTGLAVEVEKAVGAAESRFAEISPQGRGAVSLEQISEAAPISKLVGSILKYAVDNGASDVHIEPFKKKTRVRYRVDGILRETAMLPGHLHPAIVSRIKVMADLKLDETRVPQDGRIQVTVSKRRVNMRVSVYPLLDAEKAVLRILDPAKRIFDLKDLGFWGDNLKIIEKNLIRPHGMILLTGPTGCGKTTTLYATLKRLNQASSNVTTLEDPVEYFMSGVNQSQVRPSIGYTFASGLRAIIRQDPDIIMVGEIRDNETADLAVHSALTGHMVLSTLHTNDSFGAIPRLIDMEIEPFLISSSLNLVIAQRLVRKNCEHCSKDFQASPEVVKEITKELKDVKLINLDDFKDKKTGGFVISRGEGCGRCNNEGYRGRLGIIEVMEITEQMKEIITRDISIERAEKELKRQGMIEMIQDGYIKVLKKQTTIEEVLRAARE